MDGPDDPARPPLLRRNRLLCALPDADLSLLTRRAEVVPLGLKESLHEPDEPITHVHFPLDGVVSLLTAASEGQVEVVTVGNEGMVGLPVFLGADRSDLRASCQIPGSSVRLPAPALVEHLREHDGALLQLLQRYTNAMLSHLAQSVSCNRLHTVQQRAARWLLTTSDRVHQPQFPLTHEFLAQMLGVRRASVSEVAAGLQDDGLIGYGRGVMRILDRDGLQRAACDCYRITADVYARMLP